MEFCLWSRRSSAQHGLRSTRVGEASHLGPSFLRLRRATSAVAESPPRVDSGRFSVLDEDLGDTEVMKAVTQPISWKEQSSWSSHC